MAITNKEIKNNGFALGKENYILLEAAFPVKTYAKYDADKDSHPSIVGEINNE